MSPLPNLEPKPVASPLMAFVKRWIINILGVLVAAHVVSGIAYDRVTSLLVASLLLGILNAVVRPLLMLLSFPLVLLSLGLFVLVINAVLLEAIGWLVKGFHVTGFGAAFWGALVISLISLAANFLTGGRTMRVRVRRGPPPPPPPNSGDGPVIDV